MNATPGDLGGHNLAFAEALYAQFLEDPASVDPAWRAFFDPLREAAVPLGPSFRPRSIFAGGGQANGHGVGNGNGAAVAAASRAAVRQERLDLLINAFRARGHLAADLDPLGRPHADDPGLTPAAFGLDEADLDQPNPSRVARTARTIRELLAHLRTTYSRTIGVQFMHIEHGEARRWLQERMEETRNHLELTRAEQVRLLTKLTDAEIFEQFIQKKFLGAKSFSLEGGESLIPLLDLAIDRAADHGVSEVVIGMAHRGRLNVLANVLGKSPRQIFREFEDRDPELYLGRGDVKYHLGRTTEVTTAGGKQVQLTLCFNPSHLEFVSPVVEGRVRARQDRLGDEARARVMPLMIHGDAAFAGQGIVQELLNMSALPGYRTGGALHVIVNNQIGFTTPPSAARSTLYATDVARMLHAPIFHVNGEDPEAVAQVARLAMDFRARFGEDVFVDLYCYRRHGHNEGDEPAFTQPVMYKQIRARRTVRESYVERLRETGLSQTTADAIAEERREHLEAELTEARRDDYKPEPASHRWLLWQQYKGGAWADVAPVTTGVPQDRLRALLEKQLALPATFRPHAKVERLLAARAEMARGEKPLDWATAEAAAFATLLTEGCRVRLSGQDVGRGTFSHRHAVLHDAEDGTQHVALRHLAPDQAPFEVWDSPLTEVAVVGFEWGVSLEQPDGLVLWEAQFGDFCNVAQVIIDQFITSAEDKWGLLSGLVMLLPHGFEGQGPEHSSARLERFLQLAAEDNVQVVNLTTPAQYFHVLRRQVVSPWRKPLVVMSPKSLLRHPAAVSPLEDLAAGGFRTVIADERPAPAAVTRVLLVSGRLYYDLVEAREKQGRADVAIVRLEQLYPLDDAALAAALAPFPTAAPVVWVQEEPFNMGAWYFLRARAGAGFAGRRLEVVARPESASPATGSLAAHRHEQALLLRQAFGEA